MKYRKFAVFSRTILKNQDIKFFLPVSYRLAGYHPFRSFDAVLGWGFKPTAKRARDYAAKHNLPYLALEDGFIRSIGLGVEGAPALSLVVDDLGIYYDARQTSRLEQFIIESVSMPEELLIRARRCMAVIRDFRLSKYNQAKSDPQLKAAQPKVLVIDQTRGDASVTGAMADDRSFIHMLESALLNHPDEDIWVKVHPDVICGKKQGFLYPLPVENPRIKLYAASVNPWDFLDGATDIYTVSSLMGFEALIAGANVHCFGMPFYAGWGLTVDELQCERRNQNYSLEQVFAAAYIQYARYVDPVLKQRCEIEGILCYLTDTLRLTSIPPKKVAVENISWWKQRWIGDFLNSWRITADKNADVSLTWGSFAADRHFKQVYRIEDGFIRSVGLGVHFNRPVSLVCDRTGIYFDSSRPSALETLLNCHQFNPWLVYRAEKIIVMLRELGITKYNVGTAEKITVPENRPVILVPGQVEGDASIRLGSPDIKTNADLLFQVRQNNPQAYIIYKPHPDVLTGQRDNGRWQGDYLRCADKIVTDISMNVLLNVVDEVHTMTSLTGFEALLRGKKVTTYGMPFYAGWGLTTDKLTCERRKRRLSLAQLVAGALILYPTYIDPVSRQAMSVEQSLSRIKQFKEGDYQVKDARLRFLLTVKSLKKLIKKRIAGAR